MTESACWTWPGVLHSTGYGAISSRPDSDGKRHKLLAHRVLFEMARGPIPEGMQLDHLCRNRACVNPAHLEPVSIRENVLRGDTIAAANIAKDACPQGHAYTEANTYRHRNTRSCRICRRAAVRRSAAKKKAMR